MRIAAAAAALAGLAVSAPTPPLGAYEWAVTQWKAGCTAQDGCQYQFVITGPAAAEKPPTPALPAFEASCSGCNKTGPTTGYADCGRIAGDFAGRVVSRLRQPPDLLGSRTVAPLEVALIFADPKGQPNAYYNVTGFANTSFNANTGFGPLSFTITPSTIIGVA